MPITMHTGPCYHCGRFAILDKKDVYGLCADCLKKEGRTMPNDEVADTADVKLLRAVVCLALVVGLALLGSCWVQNHYEYKRVREAVKSGRAFELRNGMRGPYEQMKSEEPKK